MKWRKIEKKPENQPNVGGYRDWKPQLAVEAEGRCVYCSLRDQVLGGRRFFHVEHYRPKKHFPDLENIYANLFYACAVCNIFKGSAWFDHNAGDWENIHFPDPSEFDYFDLFDVLPTFLIEGKHLVSRYLVARLHLNRQHLIRERRVEIAFEEITTALDSIEKLETQLEPMAIAGNKDAGELLIELGRVSRRLLRLCAIKDGMPLYYHAELS